MVMKLARMIFPFSIHSNSISKVKQGGDEQATKTLHSVRLGVSEEANAVSPMKWNWNHQSLITEAQTCAA